MPPEVARRTQPCTAAAQARGTTQRFATSASTPEAAPTDGTDAWQPQIDEDVVPLAKLYVKLLPKLGAGSVTFAGSIAGLNGTRLPESAGNAKASSRSRASADSDRAST